MKCAEKDKNGLKYQKIANIMAISIDTVRKQISLAMAKLRGLNENMV